MTRAAPRESVRLSSFAPRWGGVDYRVMTVTTELYSPTVLSFVRPARVWPGWCARYSARMAYSALRASSSTTAARVR